MPPKIGVVRRRTAAGPRAASPSSSSRCGSSGAGAKAAEQRDPGGGQDEHDQRKRQRQRVDHQRVLDGKGRRAQDLAEVPPGVVHVARVERDPVAAGAAPDRARAAARRRTAPAARARARAACAAPRCAARAARAAHAREHRGQEPGVVLDRQRDAVRPASRGPEPRSQATPTPAHSAQMGMSKQARWPWKNVRSAHQKSSGASTPAARERDRPEDAEPVAEQAGEGERRQAARRARRAGSPARC